jgi:Uma2 family endonuclease
MSRGEKKMAIDLLEPIATQPPIQDDDPLYEVIDGLRVELPPMSILATVVANRIHTSLGIYDIANKRGQAMVEMLIKLPLPRHRNRRPDVLWISADRWPLDRPIPEADNAWEVIPELNVEVVSPSDLADENMDKVAEYFEAGAKMVWVVYPRHRLIYVFESLSKIHVLTEKDVADGGTVLPGYRQTVAELFPPVAVAPRNGNGA